MNSHRVLLALAMAFSLPFAASGQQQSGSREAAPASGKGQFRPGDLPVGRWQHASMGVAATGNMTTQGIQFMETAAGQHYTMNGVTGAYKREGDSIRFVGGSLGGSTGTLQCRGGFLWMETTFPDRKTQAWWGYAGGPVCR